MDNKDTLKATNDSFNVSFLFAEKEKINKKISDLSKRNIGQILEEFDPPFNFIRGILEEMGWVLYNYIKRHLISMTETYKQIYPGFTSDNFKFYFWPGFTTLEGKRVFIWKDKDSNENQEHYYSGIGYDNNEEFRNCPTNLAYNQVLNADADIFIFKGSNYFPGSTHSFRRNQSVVNENKKREYLELRKNSDNNYIFKALHVTTDESFEEKEESNHAVLIKITKQELKNSGKEIKAKLDGFLKENSKSEGENKYCKWPFDALPYEEKITEYQKNIGQAELNSLCAEYQQKVIDIQTHLYSYWIAETLGDGCIFGNAENKHEFIQKLHELLNNQDLLEWEDMSDRLEKMDEEKKRQIANPKNFKNVSFEHWYTIFHEGFSFLEDMGSTMLLSNYKIPHELLYYVSSWIEDIYNSLKILESKAITEYKTRRLNFNVLYHTQLPYIELFKDFAEKGKNPKDLIPIIEYLRYGLKIARNYLNIPELTKDLYYRTEVDVLEIIKNSQNIINTLSRDNSILGSFFKINENEAKDALKSLSEQNKIIEIENERSIKIKTHKEAFEMIVHELLFNAIKHSDHSNPNIRIVFDAEQTISIYNSCHCSKEAFNEALNTTHRQGLKIIGKLAEVLGITLTRDIDDNNMVCTIIKF